VNLFRPLVREIPFTQWREILSQNTGDAKLSCGKNPKFLFYLVSKRYRVVTNGQTDRITVANTRYSYMLALAGNDVFLGGAPLSPPRLWEPFWPSGIKFCPEILETPCYHMVIIRSLYFTDRCKKRFFTFLTFFFISLNVFYFLKRALKIPSKASWSTFWDYRNELIGHSDVS